MDNQPDGPEVSASLAALERRFGADYRIVTDPSSTSALERLDRARDRGEEGALLVADQWMPEMTGIEWSTRTRELYPGLRAASWCPDTMPGFGPAGGRRSATTG
jgi:thioredoxin reductase (NADPH)